MAAPKSVSHFAILNLYSVGRVKNTLDVGNSCNKVYSLSQKRKKGAGVLKFRLAIEQAIASSHARSLAIPQKLI